MEPYVHYCEVSADEPCYAGITAIKFPVQPDYRNKPELLNQALTLIWDWLSSQLYQRHSRAGQLRITWDNFTATLSVVLFVRHYEPSLQRCRTIGQALAHTLFQTAPGAYLPIEVIQDKELFSSWWRAPSLTWYEIARDEGEFNLGANKYGSIVFPRLPAGDAMVSLVRSLISLDQSFCLLVNLASCELTDEQKASLKTVIRVCHTIAEYCSYNPSPMTMLAQDAEELYAAYLRNLSSGSWKLLIIIGLEHPAISSCHSALVDALAQPFELPTCGFKNNSLVCYEYGSDLRNTVLADILLAETYQAHKGVLNHPLTDFGIYHDSAAARTLFRVPISVPATLPGWPVTTPEVINEYLTGSQPVSNITVQGNYFQGHVIDARQTEVYHGDRVAGGAQKLVTAIEGDMVQAGAVKVGQDAGMVKMADHSNLPNEPSAQNPLKVCEKCGYHNPATVKFCSQCGNRLLNKCPRCSSSIQPDAAFCAQCGCQVGIT